MTYRQVADHVKRRQRLLLRDMRDPEDDWPPELYMLRGDRLHAFPIPPQAFDDADSKNRLVNGVIVPAIRVGGVRVVALVVVMFMLDPDSTVAKLIAERAERNPDVSPTAGLPPFQDIEGSIEQLCVHVYDAERHEGWAARITRPKRGAPSLAPFQLAGGAPDLMTGRLAHGREVT